MQATTVAMKYPHTADCCTVPGVYFTKTYKLYYRVSMLVRTARARVSSKMLPSSLLLGRLRSALTKTGWFLRLISLASCWRVFFLVSLFDAKVRNAVKLPRLVADMRKASIALT